MKNSLGSNPTRPPNTDTVKKLRKRIIPYSQIKINEKIPPPYSILKPETNSDSDSEKSNGVRFLSARIIKIQAKKKGRLKHKKEYPI
jgi:hypothetical protein